MNVIKLVSDASLRFIDFDTARAGFNELSMLKFELQHKFNWDDYQNAFSARQRVDYLSDFVPNDFAE